TLRSALGDIMTFGYGRCCFICVTLRLRLCSGLQGAVSFRHFEPPDRREAGRLLAPDVRPMFHPAVTVRHAVFPAEFDVAFQVRPAEGADAGDQVEGPQHEGLHGVPVFMHQNHAAPAVKLFFRFIRVFQPSVTGFVRRKQEKAEAEAAARIPLGADASPEKGVRFSGMNQKDDKAGQRLETSPRALNQNKTAVPYILHACIPPGARSVNSFQAAGFRRLLPVIAISKHISNCTSSMPLLESVHPYDDASATSSEPSTNAAKPASMPEHGVS